MNTNNNQKILKFEYTYKNGEREIKEVVPTRIFYGETENTKRHNWIMESFNDEKNNFEFFVMKNINRFIDTEPQRFFCVTTYVVNSSSKLLMVFNKKLNKWVPPGGKIDNTETPDEAAIRECFEETGVKINIIGEKPPFEGSLITPFGSQCNVIKKGKRDHIDLIYIGNPISENVELKISEREASQIGWFNLSEVKSLDTFESVVYWFEKVLKFIDKS